MAGEQTNRIKILVSAVMKRISDGEAPVQLTAMYKKIGPEGFGYWLHGILCGLVCREDLAQSEFIPFFKKIIEEN
jgi:hypothetical protein